VKLLLQLAFDEDWIPNGVDSGVELSKKVIKNTTITAARGKGIVKVHPRQMADLLKDLSKYTK
jgi:hypothetical protein